VLKSKISLLLKIQYYICIKISSIIVKSYDYKGNFDGNNHKISSFKITSGSEKIGLFGSIKISLLAITVVIMAFIESLCVTAVNYGNNTKVAAHIDSATEPQPTMVSLLCAPSLYHRRLLLRTHLLLEHILGNYHRFLSNARILFFVFGVSSQEF